ncbi:hypothetical protein AX14_010660 [Amanita brunnescens Koide BX004]|nr:hypothetical protein AX14_010660 [Amanita brunnescens Koide BX004]
MSSAPPPGHQTDFSFFADDDPDIQQGSRADVHQRQGQFQGPAAMFQFAPSSPSSPRHPLGIRISMPSQQQPRPPSQSQPQSQLTMDVFGDLMQMPFQGLDSNSSQSSTSSSMATGGASMAYNSQLLLDHQFRLSQLQQLQQLQQQIFQQQIALISGQAPNLLNNTETSRDQSFTFNGLPTPAPSGELRPQQQSLDYISPIVLNNLMEAAGSAPQAHPSHQSHPSSPSLHSGTSSIIGSPAFLGTDNGQSQLGLSSNTYSSTPYVHPGSISAPEYIAFQTSPHNRSSPVDLDIDVSPLTSPWLGAQQNHHMSPVQNQNHSQQQQHRHMGGSQYQSVPLAGSTVNGNNKRSASPTSSDADVRKRQSPAVRPTNPTFSQHLDQQPRRSHRSGSRSTSSTPLLRARSGSTRQRKGSLAGALNTPAAINELPGDSPSPVDLSMPPPAPPVPPKPLVMSSGANHVPSSAINSIQQSHGPSHLTPVTPASIMNLDVKGKRLKISTESSPGALSNVCTSPVSQRSKRGVHGGLSGGTPLISPSLKPILPGPTGSSTPTVPITSSSVGAHHPGAFPTSSMLPPQVRKTSHKAAEQKRRDSLKTTFDELRGLLPPIPLPSSGHSNAGEGEDPGAGGSGAAGPSGSSAGIIFGNTVKPLLPGALPPRGPPKAGGEGPNKGVSKLQLLICGNEYIKTLKGRVERRNDEIGRLREEVRKLRQMLGVVSSQGEEMDPSGNDDGDGKNAGEQGGPYAVSVEGLMEQLDLELDLDKDIDAVEVIGPGSMEMAGGRKDDNAMESARSDFGLDDEDDED